MFFLCLGGFPPLMSSKLALICVWVSHRGYESRPVPAETVEIQIIYGQTECTKDDLSINLVQPACQNLLCKKLLAPIIDASSYHHVLPAGTASPILVITTFNFIFFFREWSSNKSTKSSYYPLLLQCYSNIGELLLTENLLNKNKYSQCVASLKI